MMPNNLWKKSGDSASFQGIFSDEVDPDPVRTLYAGPNNIQGKWPMPGEEAARQSAHDTAVKSGGFLTTKQRKGRKFGGGPVDSGT